MTEAIKTVFVAPGGGFDNVSVGTTERRDPGAGEISVRLRASSLNFHDFGIVSGAMKLKERRIPMADGAGDVIAVGDGVTEFAVGDKVVSTFFPEWLDGAPTQAGFGRVPGDGLDGYARTEVTTAATAFTLAPKGWSHAEAATLTTAAVTAWRALFEHGPLLPGQTVLVQGTGGVSIFALQMAKLAGARVIATSSSDEKLERVRSMGADETINYRSDVEWGTTVRKLTQDRGVDHVIDVGGPDTLKQSMTASRVGGHIALIGVLSGVSSELLVPLALARHLRLQALIVGSRRHQQDMVRALEASDMKPVIDSSFPLDDLVGAFRHQDSGKHFGKIVVEI